MSEARTKKETWFVVIKESALESWVRDASTLALFVGLIGIGVFLESNAMQWTGAIIGFISLVARASGKQKNLTKEQAIKFIQEMGS
jgi:hypothetical protein